MMSSMAFSGFSRNPAVLDNRNNGVLYFRGAMPFKSDTMTDESAFPLARAKWAAAAGSYAAGKAAAAAGGTKNGWYNRTDRDSSTRLSSNKLRLSAESGGVGSQAAAAVVSFKGVDASLQTQKQARLRTRNSGSGLKSRSQTAQV